MRPPLHPDMGQTVLCARVALQLTVRNYRASVTAGHTPAMAASLAAMRLPPDYPGMFRFALHSLAVYLDLGYTSSQWLASVLEAAHFGHTFRRCFFFDYKANRGAYPPVSNTGVQTSLQARPLRVGKGKGRV